MATSWIFLTIVFKFELWNFEVYSNSVQIINLSISDKYKIYTSPSQDCGYWVSIVKKFPGIYVDKIRGFTEEIQQEN